MLEVLFIKVVKFTDLDRFLEIYINRLIHFSQTRIQIIKIVKSCSINNTPKFV